MLRLKLLSWIISGKQTEEIQINTLSYITCNLYLYNMYNHQITFVSLNCKHASHRKLKITPMTESNTYIHAMQPNNSFIKYSLLSSTATEIPLGIAEPSENSRESLLSERPDRVSISSRGAVPARDSQFRAYRFEPNRGPAPQTRGRYALNTIVEY